MYNLLIALAAGLLTLGLNLLWLKPVAASVPAVGVFGLALFLLTRRISAIVEKEMMAVVPLLQGRKIEEARAHLDSMRDRYGRWQFMLDGQLESQLGMIDYLQMKWDEALPRLEKGRFRNWTAVLCIGAIHHRQGRKAKAYEEFANAAGIAPKEFMVYAVWVTLLVRDGERAAALEALNQGMQAMPESEALQRLQKTVANKKKINTKNFPETWYQFFPEEMLRQHMMRGRRGGPLPGPQQPQPRFGSRNAPRR